MQADVAQVREEGLEAEWEVRGGVGFAVGGHVGAKLLLFEENGV